MDVLIFIISMGALIFGADFIIKESEKIALHYKISPFIIGATLVALGTSLPEMAVSIAASLKGDGDIAVANVIGSTIFNIALVLASVFIIAKNIAPKRDIFAKDSAWILIPILVFILMSIDGVLSTMDGILFLILMGAYLLFLIKSDNIEEVEEENTNEKFAWGKSSLFLLIGFILTVGGADFAINSAEHIAIDFGISEWVIGLFLVAFGTSLPELTISIKAALNNNADLAIGNIIGSNVANFTMVLGVSSIVNNLSVDLNEYFFDIGAAVILSIMLVFISANKIYTKSSGIVLLVILALVVQNSL